MAKETSAKTLSLDEILARLEETETLKQQAIQQLLEQRKTLDAQLARLGYTGGAASSGGKTKKRTRRTKAEIEAARAKTTDGNTAGND